VIELRWSPRAQDDLREMDAFLRHDDPVAAQRMLNAAVEAADFLAQHPKAGPAIDKTVFRKWRVAQTPYSLIYRIRSSELRIVRVVHAAQNWQAFL
jgi:plasmid stabilization system protein ParE